MTATNDLLLFGDQTFDISSSLGTLLSHRRDSDALNRFFGDIEQLLRQEVVKLAQIEQTWFPDHVNVERLREHYSVGTGPQTALQTFLACISQLGNLIILVSNEPEILATDRRAQLVGICTGSVSAAAACMARSSHDLSRVAIDIAAVALHLGVIMQRRAEILEKTDASWAFTASNVDGTELEEVLSSYNSTMALHKQVFVSSRSRQTVTISGPPSSLQPFQKNNIFSSTKTLDLAITAPYHAAHLLGPDISNVSSLIHQRFQGHRLVRNMRSAVTGELYDADVEAMLLEIVEEILHKPLDWSVLLDGLLTDLQHHEAIVRSIGPSNSASFFVKELNAGGIQVSSTPVAMGRPTSGEKVRSNDIAIVGMSGRFPGSDNLEDFWTILKDGQDLHREIPADRFDVKTHVDPTGKLINTSLTPYGVFIDSPGLFDVRMFNMSPREAAQTCPMQRLLMLTTYEALEMAGFTAGRTPSSVGSRVGSYFGQTSDDYREVNASQDVDTFFITGGIRAFGPGRLNYHFGWDGPSYSVDTACSSSAASIQLACTALIAHEVDTAVAGGANILTASDLFAGLSRGQFLSKTGGCKTFDDSADGYCRADAVGTIVLKRLDDAIADNDNVLAVIKSIATNHSSQAVSITHPHSETQQALFQTVLRNGNLEPNEIDVVELHGTGTQAGDFTEFSSVLGVFGHNRPADQPLYIGSVKPNLGHGEAASGVTSLIKSIMMLRHSAIPPHVGIKGKINHRLPPLESTPIRLAFNETEWRKTDGQPRRLLINNFDAAGGNTSLIIEEPLARDTHTERIDPRSHHIITISGKTLSSFEQNRTRLLQFLRSSDVHLADLAYTTTARRQHHVYRRAYSCKSLAGVATLIERDAAESISPKRNVKPRLVFAFTGQGSHYDCMGKQLYETNALCRQRFAGYNSICLQLGFPPFIGLITGQLKTQEASPSQIQLAIVSFELVIFSLWHSWGVEPDVVLGHSLGEYAALVAAGVLSAWDALYLVGSRAQLMETNCITNTHRMLAIKLGEIEVKAILQRSDLTSCEIACINGPQATVISGELHEISKLQGIFASEGVKITTLTVPYAFHSKQMDGILDEFRVIASYAQFSTPAIPVASALTGKVIRAGDIDAEYLVRQCRQTVDFAGALRTLQADLEIDANTAWIEIGSKPICLSMIKTTLGIAHTNLIASVDQNAENWATLSSGLGRLYGAGYNISWNELHKPYEQHLRLLELPSYAFDLKNHWLQYDGDWSISKGHKSQISEVETVERITTSVHHLEEERFEHGNVHVKFTTDLADKALRSVLEGHQVNGVGLCPSSLYADMAMTIGDYVYGKLYPDEPRVALDIAQMEVTKPVIADHTKSEQIIAITATKSDDSNTLRLNWSTTQNGATTQHAQCFVHFSQATDWLSDWARNKYLVDAQINRLHDAKSIEVHKLHRQMVYRLFSTLVTYSAPFRGLSTVYLNSKAFEAVGDVQFQTSGLSGDFFFSPYWIDSLLHLSGFVLNGSDETPEDAVYISHGWKNLRFPTKLQEDRTYQSYVRMQPVEGDVVMAGDIYVFDGDAMVGLCLGLKFHRIKKSVLAHLLPGQAALPNASGALLTSATKAAPLETIAKTSVVADPLSPILTMIAAEVQVSLTELVDHAEFNELGVDSLLSLSIAAKLREMTSHEILPSWSINYPTVGDLRAFLGHSRQDSTSFIDSDTSSLSSVDIGAVSTAATSVVDLGTTGKGNGSPSAALFRKVIAEELGVSEQEITPEIEFADLGLDSLMTLVILNTIKNMTGWTIPPDFFLQNPTLHQIGLYYGNSSSTSETAVEPTTRSPSIVSFALPSSSILLQGTKDAAQNLFLLPDGSGSAASYAGLPFIADDLAIYGLNSPHLRNPTAFDDSIESIAASYVTEIRAQRPKGPYVLGGWSIGGVYAFEAARLLINAGEVVEGLILIDSPCPKHLPPMSLETIDILKESGVFGNKTSISSSTRQHFLGSIRALKSYQPKPLPAGHRNIPSLAIWARQGVFESEQFAENLAKVSKQGLNDWLLFPRSKHGSTGWDELLTKFESTVVDGTHFTMMKEPQISHVAKQITAFITRR